MTEWRVLTVSEQDEGGGDYYMEQEWLIEAETAAEAEREAEISHKEQFLVTAYAVPEETFPDYYGEI